VPFKYDDLRHAALFSALTGLRYSDIAKLTWQEVQHSQSQGFYVRFKQQKTKHLETLPISEGAFDLLGPRGDATANKWKHPNTRGYRQLRVKFESSDSLE
jgi:hypothetical protein